MIVVGSDPDCELARVAHPPIDAILLKNISKAKEIENPHMEEWAKIKWTQLNEERYYALIDQLRSCLGASEPMWLLERYWTVT